MAYGAVQSHLIETETKPLGNANRHFVALLKNKTQGCVATRQFVLADLWQDFENLVGRQQTTHCIGQGATGLAADGAVFEVLHNVVVVHWPIGIEAPHQLPDNDDHYDGQHGPGQPPPTPV